MIRNYESMTELKTNYDIFRALNMIENFKKDVLSEVLKSPSSKNDLKKNLLFSKIYNLFANTMQITQNKNKNNIMGRI